MSSQLSGSTPAAPEPVPSSIDPRAPLPPPGNRTPEVALAELLSGNRRFISAQPVHGHNVTAAAAASGDQQPYAVVVGCLDSRVPLEAIFDQTFGSMCVVRSGGHVLDRAVLGSIEFAVTALRVPLVMVLGHERCGAVAATVAALRTGERPDGPLGYLVDQITPAVREVGVDRPDVVPSALRRHITRTMAVIAGIESLAGPLSAGQVRLVGAVYDLDSGRVDLLDDADAGGCADPGGDADAGDARDG
ncbi:carbonic anhydrase [Plantactinospora sp. GCM10030261]|uniref:carbonic anhydrase n=1 Tax=Plantactinospora sp. GCM10030261 TaxID=3273420 RepID=UPI00361861F4